MFESFVKVCLIGVHYEDICWVFPTHVSQIKN